MENIYHFFQRACQREPAPVRGIPGLKLIDQDGNSVVFWMEVEDGRIGSVQFQCTTCFTLVGLCQHLSEALPGMTLEQAGMLTTDWLLSLHPEIPGMRHDRAALAIDGVRSAVRKHMELQGACS